MQIVIPEIKILEKDFENLKSDLLIIPCFCKNIELFKNLENISISDNYKNYILEIANEEEFNSEFSKSILFRNYDKKHKRILLIGLDEIFDENENTNIFLTNILEKNFTKIIHKNVLIKNIENIFILLNYKLESNKANCLIQALLNSFFQFTYRSLESLEKPPIIQKIFFAGELVNLLPDVFSNTNLTKLQTLAYSPTTAMNLVNSPPNIKNCESLVQTAEHLAQNSEIKVKIERDINWISKEMPSFYTVAKGSLSSDPPVWLNLELLSKHYSGVNAKPADTATPYVAIRPAATFNLNKANPDTATFAADITPSNNRTRKKICLVGKSVIFDTGGYQLKPDHYMNTMKADMTGGASVLAVFETFTKSLSLSNIDLFGFLAATPNMVDANAFLPDSIISSTCGKKIEIKHTDAEGRLTLIDAVSMAQKLNPDLIITIATLTGSATRAVGPRIALMGNNKKYLELFEKSAIQTGDAVQILNVENEDFESIKSKLDSADLINDSHNKYRGAQSACAFIMNGISKNQSLLHLDIAGGDMTEDGKATGIAVKTLILFLLELDKI